MPEISPELDQTYTAYFSMYGAFLGLWQSYDLAVEMLVGRELKLSIRETSIVCSALPFGIKYNILLALLNRDPANERGISILRNVQQISERNSIVHGFIHARREESGPPRIVNRDIKNGKYSVKSKRHSPHAHMRQFLTAFKQLLEWAKISAAEIDRYCVTLESDAKDHSNQDNSHPESHSNSEQPNPAQSSMPPQSTAE
jgi:hypothetical protein